MRALERNAEIETRYGGGFVQSIDGLAEARARRRSLRLVLLRRRGRVAGRRRRLLACTGGESDLVGLPRLDGDDARAGGGRLLAAAVHRRLRRAAAPGRGRMPRRRASLRDVRGARCEARRREARRPARRRARSASWSGPGPGCGSDPAAAQIEGGPQKAASSPISTAPPVATRSSGLDEDGAAGAASFGAGRRPGRRDPPLRSAAGLAGHGRRRRPAVRAAAGACSTHGRPARPLRGGDRRRGGDAAAGEAR